MTEQTTQPNTNPAPTSTPTAGVFEQLVGPGKKFSDPEALAKGKMEADSFVKQLTGEAAQLREIVREQDARLKQLESRTSILDRLNGEPQGAEPNPAPVVKAPAPATPEVKGLTAEDVTQLIENRDRNKSEQSNIAKVDQTLFKTLGTDAAAYVKQRAVELGMPVEDLRNIAAKSPSAFFNMIGLSETAPTSGQSNSMYVPRNQGNVTDTRAPVRNQAYYEALKNKMGAKAFILDKNIQIQLHKDMNALGDSWES